MARLSFEKKLPNNVREMIVSYVRENSPTVDQFYDWLDDLLSPRGISTSRSAAHRYLQREGDLAKEMQRERAVAEAIVGAFGDEPDSKVARANIEMMHTIVSRALRNPETGGLVRFEPAEAMFLSSALQKLASAKKTDVERVVQIERRAADRAKREAAAQLDAALKDAGDVGEMGLSAERVAQLRRNFLGARS